MGTYFPIGFDRDPAHPVADASLQRLEERMIWLNRCHELSGMEGHVFAAALYAYAMTIPSDTVIASPYPSVWELLMNEFTDDEIAQLTINLEPAFTDTLPRLEFPNAIALVDCRFVTTKEWEFLRRYSIGGSEVSGITGTSHYSTPLKLYYDKRGEIPDVNDINKQYIFDYGHSVEDYVIEKTCSLLGCIHYPEFRMFRHREYSYITANPDGILMFPDGQLALFEAKTATRFKAKDWEEGIPDYYAPQPQQYLEVLDDPRLTKGYIGVVLGGLPNNFAAHRYVRENQMAQDQVSKIQDFWTFNFLPEQAPEISGCADKDLDAVYCRGKICITQATEQLSDAVLDDFIDYFELKDQQKEINKKVKELKTKEAELMTEILGQYPGDTPVIITKKNGLSYYLRRTGTVKESVDQANLPSSVKAEVKKAMCRSASPSGYYTNPKVSKQKIRAKKGGKKAP